MDNNEDKKKKYFLISKLNNQNYFNMKMILFLISVVIFSISDLSAQTPDEIIKKFFDIYQKNEPIKAIDDLYSHTPWLDRMKDDVEKLKTQFRDLKNIVGEYNGYELLYTKKVNDFFVITTYIIKFDRQPIRFNFEFYKPKDKWYLYSFSYDDSFDDDLENALKQQN